MILFIRNVGLDALLPWLNSPLIIFFIVEGIAVLLGIICGAFSQKKRGNFLLLSFPGLFGCFLGVFLYLGSKRLSDGYIWSAFIPEYFVVFSVAACIVLSIKKQHK